MPTGSGKSLGYQLPAVMLSGTTLVVSPLISLMKDQVDELNRRGIAAGALHSMLSAETRPAVVNAARAGRLRLLYVAPERFASEHFLRLLPEFPVARFVVDEAHCVSEWGHDFRPDYRRLRAAAGLCLRADGESARPPMAAFTATATPEVRDDITALLGLVQPQVLVAGFDRPNIYLRVERVSDDEQKNELLPGLARGRRALVYAATRRTVEATAALLKASAIDAAAYHAGLKDDERSLRGTILRYFGDPAARERCDACSACRPGVIDAYERDLVRKILSGIARAGERYGRVRIIAMLRGDVKDLPPSLSGLSTTGLLRHEHADTLHGWIDAAVAAGLIVVSKDQYRTLSLTDAGRDVMRRRTTEVPVTRPVVPFTMAATQRRYRADGTDDLRRELLLGKSRWSSRRARRDDLDPPFEEDDPL